MTLDDMKEKALSKVEAANPGNKNYKPGRVLENILDGTLISITFDTPTKEESNHVHFSSKGEVRIYRWHADVLNAIAGSKERLWFFRFLEFAGVGGLIAFVLVMIFAIFLCVLAFYNPEFRKDILDVVKLSFTTILGYFFGSQAAAKR